MLLDDTELRDLTVDLLRAETARDKQVRLGASDLAGQCDRCLAMKFAGVTRVSAPQAERVWLGAKMGTALHGELQGLIDQHSMDPSSSLFHRLAGVRAERHLKICYIEGYGWVLGTIDVSMPLQLVDWKGSTRKRSALLRDFLAYMRGEEAPFGRTHKDVKLSEREYGMEMEAMVYKVNAYFAQTMLYGHARALAGSPVEKAAIVWINRDGTGFYDLPHGSRYSDETVMRDIWVLSFDYNEEAAQQVITRAQSIRDRVAQLGSAPDRFEEFEQGSHCWTCSHEEQAARESLDVVAKMAA